MSTGKRRFYPDAFKHEAVERVRTSGLSITAVATDLGIQRSMLSKWVRQVGGTQAAGAALRPNTRATPPSPSDLASENARLRRENERLRMERDILKEAALMVASPAFGSDRPTGKVRVR